MKDSSFPQSFAEVQRIDILVKSDKELAEALQHISPGTTIKIAAGTYSHGIFLKNINGTSDSPITIRAENALHPPIFRGIGEGVKLSSCSYIKLSTLIFQGFTKNGINIDDGDNEEKPSHHLILDNLTILDTGAKGNHDALKLSRLEHVIVRGCRFEGWGGSGIDMVGCRNTVVEGCTFVGKETFRTMNAIQIKGGSHSILVQTSFFQSAGERTINIGGSTALPYFRKPIMEYEAKEVTFAGNTVIGSEASIAWVTSQKGYVHHNLFYFPEKWVGRILQESKDQRFAPCQGGLFTHNMTITDDRVRTFFSIGPRTLPESFFFQHNAWYRSGSTEKPDLPAPEKSGIYNIDPEVKEPVDGKLTTKSHLPQIRELGPWAYTPWTIKQEFADIIPPKPPPQTILKNSTTRS